MSELVGQDEQQRFNQMSDQVRMFCAERCHELLKALTPYVNGDFGDIQPGHVNGYMSVLKELARLYQASSRPVFVKQVEVGIPREQVELMVEVAVLQAVEVAVEEALEVERVRTARALVASTDEARDRVRVQLRGR